MMPSLGTLNSSRTSTTPCSCSSMVGDEHAHARGVDVLDDLVDDAVQAHVDLGALGLGLGLGLGAHVEADDDRVGGVRQHDVGLVDRADAAVDDVDADLGLVHLVQRVHERLDGALDVGLDDEVEVLELALLDAVEQVVEGDVALGALGDEPLAQRALLGELTGGALVGHDLELVAGARHRRQAEDLDRVGGAGGRDRACPSGRPARGRGRAPCPRRRRRRRWSVPRWTSTVATGPRPRSRLPSTTTPRALAFGLALRSATSATSRTISSRSSMPMFFLALTS